MISKIVCRGSSTTIIQELLGLPQLMKKMNKIIDGWSFRKYLQVRDQKGRFEFY